MAASFRFSTQATGADSSVLNHFLELPQNGKLQAEYIWIGGTGEDIRSKTKTIDGPVNSLKDLPEWNFDGSSTGQAKGHYSEVWLKPVKYVPDPFRKAPNILVLCECLNAKTMQPINTNTRSGAAKIFSEKKISSEEPWFGFEQEYTLFDTGLFAYNCQKKKKKITSSMMCTKNKFLFVCWCCN